MRLVNLGANLAVKNFYGDTALSLACIHSLPTVAIAIMNDMAVDINNVNKDGATPLMYASKNGLLNVVNVLISRGAVINKKNNNGYTARNYAIVNKQTNTDSFLENNGAEAQRMKPPASASTLRASNPTPDPVALKADGGRRRSRTRKNKRSRSGRSRGRKSRRS